MPHIHEKIDFTVEVFIVHNDEVLLRKHDKYGFWLSVGGHIELDEDPLEAARREVKEEVGLDVTLLAEEAKSANEKYRELSPPRFMNRHVINDTHEHVTFVYFATTVDRNISEGESEKSKDMKWFSAADLDDPQYDVRPNVKKYALAALEAYN